MATGSLPGTFRFRKLGSLLGFLQVAWIFFIFLFLGRLSLISQVYATPWYTVIDGGILSGSEIRNPDIPNSPTAPYEPETIQNPGSGDGSPGVGALISGGEQDVDISGDVPDAFIKKTLLGLGLNRLDVPTVASTPGITELTECGTFSVDPGGIYKMNAECFSDTTAYKISSSGLAVLVVDDPKIPISLNTDIRSSEGGGRLLVITNSQIEYLNNVSIQNRELSILTTGTSSLTVRSYGEGPVVSVSDIILPNDAGVSPGSVVTYNPIYVSELTNLGLNNFLEIKGLLESKVSWRYE